jgi:hypothetical protein
MDSHEWKLIYEPSMDTEIRRLIGIYKCIHCGINKQEFTNHIPIYSKAPNILFDKCPPCILLRELAFKYQEVKNG